MKTVITGSLLICAWMFLSGPAFARDKPIIMLLDPGPVDPPAYVCLVGPSVVNGTSIRQLPFTWRENAWVLDADDDRNVPKPQETEPDRPPAEDTATTAQEALEAQAHKATSEAVSMMRYRMDSRCAAGTECDATLSINPLADKDIAAIRSDDASRRPVQIGCQANPLRQNGQGRVAVLRIRYPDPYNYPTVKGLQVEGTLVRVVVDVTEDAALGVDVLGGHYQLTGGRLAYVRESVGSVVSVALRPLCRPYVIHVPGIPTLEEGDQTLTFSIDGWAKDRTSEVKCPLESNRMRPVLPIPTDGRALTLQVDVQSRGVSLGLAEWRGVDPPPSIRMGFGRVNFTWKRHCLFPAREKCPDVHFTDSSAVERARSTAQGATCNSAEDWPNCHYRCTSPSPFELPQSITFVPPDGRDYAWEDSLLQADQELHGYLRPEDRYLTLHACTRYWLLRHDSDSESRGVQIARAHEECNDAKGGAARARDVPTELPAPGSSVESLALISPDGLRHEVPMGARSAHIPFPGGACQDSIAYEIRGDRTYRTRAVPIGGGTIDIPPPESSARWFSLSMDVNGGIKGLLDDDLSKMPVGSLGIGALFSPRNWLIGFPLRVGTRVTSQPFWELGDTLDRPVKKSRAGAEVVFLTGMTFHLTSDLELDALVGYVFHTSVIASDRGRVGPFHHSFTAAIPVRVRLVQGVWFEFTGVVDTNTRVRRFHFEPAGSPSIIDDSYVGLYWTGGFRFELIPR